MSGSATKRSSAVSGLAARRCPGPNAASCLVIWKRRFSEEPRAGAARKLSGKEEALLVATACSKPPAGRARWTLELLAGEMVKLTEHAGLSRETVRQRLAENDLKPWRKDMWCIPEVDGTYVARMEGECQFSCVRAFHGRLSSTECSRQTLGKEDGELRVCGSPLDGRLPMNAKIPQRQVEQFGGGFV